MKAIVNTAVCGLYGKPTYECTLEDEALYGMIVDIGEEAAPGWVNITTHYRYSGIVCADDLIMGDEAAAEWEQLPKMVVRSKNCCDVLSEPRVQGVILAQLVRGCVIAVCGEAKDGWQPVQLADGRKGWVMAGILAPYHTAPLSADEDTLRDALVEAALLYKGTHYRWGGKSPLGIDCSGMVAMAYMLCGILIYRDADIVEGFPIHEITRDRLKKGDLLFFPGHVAMYMGDHLYCHSTAHAGDDGFTLNSLDPSSPIYREDLANGITQIGSYFTKG